MDRLVKANWVQSWLTRCSSRSCTLALQPSELRSPQVGEQVTPYIFTACSPCKVHWSQGAEASRPFVADTAVEASESEANDLSDLRSQLLLHEGVFLFIGMVSCRMAGLSRSLAVLESFWTSTVNLIASAAAFVRR